MFSPALRHYSLGETITSMQALHRLPTQAVLQNFRPSLPTFLVGEPSRVLCFSLFPGRSSESTLASVPTSSSVHTHLLFSYPDIFLRRFLHFF